MMELYKRILAGGASAAIGFEWYLAKRIEQLEAALREISLNSQNTMGGNSTDLGRIARKALEGEDK